MSFTAECPDCGRRMQLNEKHAGKRGKCPQCGAAFIANPIDENPAEETESSELYADEGLLDTGEALGFDPALPSSPRRANGAASPRANGAKANKAVTTVDATAAADGDVPASAAPRLPQSGWAMLGGAAAVSAVLIAGAYFYGVKAAEASIEQERKAAVAAANKQIEELRPKAKKLADELPVLEKKVREATGEKSFKEHVLPGIVKVLNYQRGQLAGTGSGFIVNDKQWIVTNHHVIQGAADVKVKTFDGTEYVMEGVLADPFPMQDLALLKPKDKLKNVKVLPISKQRAILPGDLVFGIGSPGKHEFTVARGVVSRMITQANVYGEGLETFQSVFLPQEFNVDIIEHDARIFPGNSGGPLLNENLEVIGVNTWLGGFRTPNYHQDINRITFGMASHYKHFEIMIADAEKSGEVISFKQNFINKQGH